ncbi:MAG: glycosyltransferase family A protein [Pseudomonadota bacterium]|jgi:glycosyltransferase involved in cell wall biosynthesis|nr:glycosyltransferase family A protein [Pseudomonadota bacterium]
MPVYNGATFLPRAFSSLAAQTFRDFELVIVDDGSTDGSGALAERLIAEGRLIGRVVSTPNRGAEQARDVAVAHASTDVIAQCDCDDWWAPSYLSDMMSTLTTHPQVDALYSDMIDIYPDGRQIRKSDVATWVNLSQATREDDLYIFSKGGFLEMVLGGHVMYPQCTVYRKRAYEGAGPYADGILDFRVSLDWYFSLRLARVSGIAFLKRPLLHRYLHSANTTGDSLRMFSCTCAIFRCSPAPWPLSAVERRTARRRAAQVAAWAAEAARDKNRWTALHFATQSFMYKPSGESIKQAIAAMAPKIAPSGAET